MKCAEMKAALSSLCQAAAPGQDLINLLEIRGLPGLLWEGEAEH